jgi:hypothetical protein
MRQLDAIAATRVPQEGHRRGSSSGSVISVSSAISELLCQHEAHQHQNSEPYDSTETGIDKHCFCKRLVNQGYRIWIQYARHVDWWSASKFISAPSPISRESIRAYVLDHSASQMQSPWLTD